jgi:heme O synthase-like polyprenyltransferase
MWQKISLFAIIIYWSFSKTFKLAAAAAAADYQDFKVLSLRLPEVFPEREVDKESTFCTSINLDANVIFYVKKFVPFVSEVIIF